MGSLMAGWDSPVSDPKAVKFQRNKSLTKEEIATFWRSKKKTEDQSVKSSSKSSYYHDDQENRWEEGEKKLRRSSSVPPLQRADEAGANTYNLTAVTDVHQEQTMDKLLQKNGWWISSNWAFLNEPPVISEGPNHKSKYASQFHVAHVA